MAQDLSIEDPDTTFFITSRTIGSRLWLMNNPILEKLILSFLAKYQSRYGVELYAFILMGNHYHLVARFPQANKAAFVRSFNSIVARLVGTHAKGADGGRVWARRARCQVLPRPEDIAHWVMYSALNPVSSGLVKKISDYPSYNSFSDAIHSKERNFDLVNWEEFNSRKRFNSKLTAEDCSSTYTLKFSRLPGCEKMSPKTYREHMLTKAEQQRLKLVKARIDSGKGFATKEALLATKVGSKPKSTKKGDRFTKRPLVLTLCAEARSQCLEKYFSILHAFRKASLRFRSGMLRTVFPAGTYRPILHVACAV